MLTVGKCIHRHDCQRTRFVLFSCLDFVRGWASPRRQKSLQVPTLSSLPDTFAFLPGPLLFWSVILGVKRGPNCNQGARNLSDSSKNTEIRAKENGAIKFPGHGGFRRGGNKKTQTGLWHQRSLTVDLLMVILAR